MRAVDVNATVAAGGLVEIKLPRLRVVVERRQAERLRAVLNTVLPPDPKCPACGGEGRLPSEELPC